MISDRDHESLRHWHRIKAALGTEHRSNSEDNKKVKRSVIIHSLKELKSSYSRKELPRRIAPSLGVCANYPGSWF